VGCGTREVKERTWRDPMVVSCHHLRNDPPCVLRSEGNGDGNIIGVLACHSKHCEAKRFFLRQ